MPKLNVETNDIAEEVLKILKNKGTVISCREPHCCYLKVNDCWNKTPTYLMGVIELYKSKEPTQIQYSLCDIHQQLLQKKRACGCKECCGKH